MLFVKTLTWFMVMLTLLSLSLRPEVISLNYQICKHTVLHTSISLSHYSPTEVLKHVSKCCIFPT